MFFPLISALTLIVSSVVYAQSGGPPSCNGTSAVSRTVGLYRDWGSARGCQGVYPEQINAGGYTHLNYGYAYIDPITFELAPMSTITYEMWTRITALRALNPGMQIWLSVGGFDMSDQDQPTNQTFSQLVNNPPNWQAFSASLTALIQAYGFDGVDIDWEYPGSPERGGSSDDYSSFPGFVSYLKGQLDATGFTYGLSVTVPALPYWLQYFDLANLAPSIDWFNLAAYDVHGLWDTSAYPGDVVRGLSNLTETDLVLRNSFWPINIDPAKINLGVGLYGRTFTIADPLCLTPGCPFTAGGIEGECTSTVGFLSYDEMTEIVDSPASVVSYYDGAEVAAVAYGNKQLATYETARSLSAKVNYANAHCLGGMMVYATDLDKNSSGIYALSTATRQIERAAFAPSLSDTVSQCQWTDCINPDQTCVGGGNKPDSCIADCPAGTSTQWVESGTNVCGADSASFRRFCCPNNAGTTCRSTHSSSISCNGRCSGNEVRIGTSTTDCVRGHDDLCCTRSSSVIAQEQCAWTTICTAGALCPNNQRNVITTSTQGDGGEPCSGGLTKTLCCSDPNPYSNCQWNNGGSFDICQGTCSTSQTIVATSSEGCSYGSSVLCCDGSSNDIAVLAFKLELLAFLQNTTCPLEEVLLPADDTSTSDLQAFEYLALNTKRDQIPTHKNLPKRDFDTIGFVGIEQLLGSMYGTSYRSMQMAETWDDVVGDTNLHTTEYMSYFDTYDIIDPATSLIDLVCSWNEAREKVANLSSSNTEICVPAWVNGSSSGLDKRVFTYSGANTAPRMAPNAFVNTGALFSQIIAGTLPLLYSRITPWPNPLTGMLEPNLEVTFDIRGQPDLQDTPADIFAVLHFHVGSMDPDPANPTAPLYPSVQAAAAFHGQIVFVQNGLNPNDPTEWRVDYGTHGNNRRGRRNERASFVNCGRGLFPPGIYIDRGWRTWYPGHINDANLENQLGVWLRDRGVLVEGPNLGNWDTTTGTWRWDPTRPINEYPNQGYVDPSTGNRVAPTDMRPVAQGGSINWPT